MKTCDKCHIEINTIQKYCPLCHQVLQGDIDEGHIELYSPNGRTNIQINRTMQRIVIFVSLLAMIILGVIDLVDQSGNTWSILPNAVIFYALLSIQFSIFTKTRSTGKILGLSLLLMILVIVINFLLEPNNLWSLDYVMPSIILANNITLIMIMMIKKHGMKEEGKHYVGSVLTSSIPIILYFMGIIKDPTIPVILAGVEIASLFLMIVFFPRALFDALKKIFHF